MIDEKAVGEQDGKGFFFFFVSRETFLNHTAYDKSERYA